MRYYSFTTKILGLFPRTHYLLARSSAHALQVAVATGIHRTGKWMAVYEISLDYAPREIQDLAKSKAAGRISLPTRSRNYHLLILENSR